MSEQHFLCWIVCLGTLFICKIISNYLFINPRKNITYSDSNMPYKYFKIYNVTKGLYAYDLSGEDDPETIWDKNDWDKNDALLGFYTSKHGDIDLYNVIFCRPGYAIYIQSEDNEKGRDNYTFDNEDYCIPPAILINLNNASDIEFIHTKNYPEEMDTSDSESDYESNNKFVTDITDNQKVIDFLYRCKYTADNPFKKLAYDNAIKEIYNYSTVINPKQWWPRIIGSTIERKVREFLDGIPEDDIINS